METDFQKVGKFHAKFGLGHVRVEQLTLEREAPYRSLGPGAGVNAAGPRALPPDAVQFRADFMQEELDEFRMAVKDGDQAKAFDALLDLCYVTLGTAHLMGFPWPEGMAEVQRANMSKERATSSGDPRSKRGHALDVVKPAGWQPPDIAGVLSQFGWPRTQV